MGNLLIYSATEDDSASGRGRCCAAGRRADREGASLSGAAGASDRANRAWRRVRSASSVIENLFWLGRAAIEAHSK
jgi:hypothetical protein